MKRHDVAMILAGILLVGACIAWLIYASRPQTQPLPQTPRPPKSSLDDAAIRTALSCGRMTADYRETDPLCTNLEYARALFARGITFGAQLDGAGAAPAGTSFVIIKPGQTATPLADTHIKISINRPAECAKPPCEVMTEQKLTDGITDSLGVLTYNGDLPAVSSNLYGFVVTPDRQTASTTTTLRHPSNQYILTVR